MANNALAMYYQKTKESREKSSLKVAKSFSRIERKGPQ